MATGFEDNAKINALPKEGLHCFPANTKQIKTRRIVTVVLFIISLALVIVSFCLKNKNYPLGIIAAIVLVVCAFVFAQTFLIEKYRVAIDYSAKQLVLRYRFSLIPIPFESFDARDGEPDKAEALLETASKNPQKVHYLVLDNVFDEACFQTSSKDLASSEDFFKLREESFAIAEAYGARNCEDAIKPNAYATKKADNMKKDLNDNDIDDIVSKAFDDVDAESEEDKK